MNKLECEWFTILAIGFWKGHSVSNVRAQAKRYRTSRSSWYKPDVTCLMTNNNGVTQECAFECKGPKQGKNVARGILSLKVAASQFPEVRWVLVWKDQGKWCEQEVMP